MIQEAGSMNFTRILSTLKGAKAAARLLLASGKAGPVPAGRSHPPGSSGSGEPSGIGRQLRSPAERRKHRVNGRQRVINGSGMAAFRRRGDMQSEKAAHPRAGQGFFHVEEGGFFLSTHGARPA
jgi:hypothetical protein